MKVGDLVYARSKATGELIQGVVVRDAQVTWDGDPLFEVFLFKSKRTTKWSRAYLEVINESR